jgi:hypothetical protein
MRFCLTLILALCPVMGRAQMQGVPRSCVPDSSQHIDLPGSISAGQHGDSMTVYISPNAWACRNDRQDTVAVYSREDIQRFQIVVSPLTREHLRKYFDVPVIMKGRLRDGSPHHTTRLVFVPDQPLSIVELKY